MSSTRTAKNIPGVSNLTNTLICHSSSSNHFTMGTKNQPSRLNLFILTPTIHQMPLTGELKVSSTKLRIKDSVVHVGLSVLYQDLKAFMRSEKELFLISVNNKSLTVAPMATKDATEAISLKLMITLSRTVS